MGYEPEYKILAEFEFLVDLDFAMYSMMKVKYSESSYANKRIFRLPNELDVKKMLIYRENINPLEKIFPGMDTNTLYKQILNDNEEELLQYAILYDTFRLLVTFLERATSVKSITVLCRNQLEADFISNFNTKLETVIANKSEVDISKYNILYIKNFYSAMNYKNLSGKSIYVANAKYNYDSETRLLNPEMVVLFSESNEIKLIDLYLDIKYKP